MAIFGFGFGFGFGLLETGKLEIRCDELEINSYLFLNGFFPLFPHSFSERGVEHITIDSLNLHTCDYIKIDVEGAEILVLMGAIETIKKFKPVIMFENTDKKVSDEMKTSLSIDFVPMDILEFLKNLDYVFEKIDNNNLLAVPYCIKK